VLGIERRAMAPRADESVSPDERRGERGIVFVVVVAPRLWIERR
jgi:hypothetical protein